MVSVHMANHFVLAGHKNCVGFYFLYLLMSYLAVIASLWAVWFLNQLSHAQKLLITAAQYEVCAQMCLASNMVVIIVPFKGHVQSPKIEL